MREGSVLIGKESNALFQVLKSTKATRRGLGGYWLSLKILRGDILKLRQEPPKQLDARFGTNTVYVDAGTYKWDGVSSVRVYGWITTEFRVPSV